MVRVDVRLEWLYLKWNSVIDKSVAGISGTIEINVE